MRKKRNEFNPDAWRGRTFRCLTTDEKLTIPDDISAKSFYSFGECFIDVGDGFYFRTGGQFIEVEKSNVF
jgi:hypothetical protein